VPAKTVTRRVLGWGSAGALLALLAIAAWLGSERGHRWIAERLIRAVEQRSGLVIRVRQLRGTLVFGVRVDGVTIHDRQRRMIASADALVLRYGLIRLVRRHELDEVLIERPAVWVGRLPAGSAAMSPAWLTAHQTVITGGAVHIDDRSAAAAVGEIEARGSLEGGEVELEARARIDRYPVVMRGRVDLMHHPVRLSRLMVVSETASVRLNGPVDGAAAHLEARLGDHPMRVDGVVGVRRGSLAARAVTMTMGETRVWGGIEVAGSDVRAALRAHVAPAEARLLRLRPSAPINGRIRLAGPIDRVRVTTHAALGAASVQLEGRCDLRSRRGLARFTATRVRTFELVGRGPRLMFSGAFTLDASLSGRALVGRLTVRRGALSVRGRSFERLDGAALVRLARRGEARITTLRGRLAGARPERVSVATDVRWGGRRLEFRVHGASLGDSHSTGSVLYHHAPTDQEPMVDVAARAMHLSPALIAEFLRARPRAPWLGEADLRFRPHLRQTNLALRISTVAGPLSIVGTLRRGGGDLEVSQLQATLGKSWLHGAGRFRAGQMNAVFDAALEAPTVHRLVPAIAPALPVLVRGAVAGPLDRLDLRGVLVSGPSTVAMSGRLELPQRRLRAVGLADTLVARSLRRASPEARASAEVAVDGRIGPAGPVGTVTIRGANGIVKGSTFFRGRLDGRLNGPHFSVDAVEVYIPGALLAGQGGGSWRDFRVPYRGIILNAQELKGVAEPVRLLIGLTRLTPGRAVVGAVQRRYGGKVEVSRHVIPPIIRGLGFLLRLFTGQIRSLRDL
jgi:hypothetical protein